MKVTNTFNTKLEFKKNITGDYIAGFVQADGSFSAVLTSKTRNSKRYFNISLVFTIVQHEKYKDLILEIQKYFKGVGNWYLNKNDKTIRYQVTKQSDLINVIIPFFMEHQLRSGKLLSFLHFKYIATVMSTRAHWNNKKMLLSLIVLASHLNPLGKIGNKIRYLDPEEQKYVINNIQPEGIDISELTESIKNFKQNELTLEFIHGLFDGDGNLSIYFVKPSEAKLNRVSSENQSLEEIKTQHDYQNETREIKLYVGYSFTIVQDKHNLSLLNEVKSFFNETGGIYEINDNCSIYKAGSKSILASIILPKMAGKTSLDWVDCSQKPVNNDLTSSELNLPLLKYNKIYYSGKILKILSNDKIINNENMDQILELSYYVRDESDNITLEKYIENFRQKWLL
uniref:Homing endonuclease LAGLIDADG domain-containing protein n=1 Tax=Dactylella sp. TaxID=1814903 RepID=A0A482DT30_9PEZI|nr:hypothetical protein [Dactylella sp.]